MPIDQSFIEKVRDFLETYPRTHSLNSLRNAFSLLEKARQFHGVDDNISAFCAITAEEEAVSSIFLALKHLGYDSTKNINHYNHVHKSAFFPFCQAVAKSFEVFNKSEPRLSIDNSGNYPKLFIHFLIEDFNGQELAAKPDVPFGFSISNDSSLEDFEENLKHYFGEEYQNLEKWLKNAANKRNQVLYATPKGIPKVKITEPEKYFGEYEKKINTIMLLYFLIAPYKEKQLFIQQALNSFVKMIGKIPNEEKLLEMIENIDKAPVAYEVNLGTGKMSGVQINGSAIQEIEFKTNEINIKIG